MAGKQKTFDQDTKAKIENALDSLPDKPPAERPITSRELITSLRTKIRAAQAKGYTLAEIVDLFKSAGAPVSMSTIKAALKGSSTRRKATSTGNDKGGAENG